MITTIVEGGICGNTWMPDTLAGMPCIFDVRRERGRFTAPKASFREIFLHWLMENGGDFQNARFTFDTCVVVISRKRIDDKRSTVRVRSYRVADLPDCEDLVAENDMAEFYGGASAAQ